MRLRLVRQPFDHPGYIFEEKHDGLRAIVYIDEGKCRLISRNLKTLPIESLQMSLAQLPVKNAILDGEIVCLDEQRANRFNDVGDRKVEPILYAFDLLWLDDKDLRRLPLIARKRQLRDLIYACDRQRILYSPHVEGQGRKLFEEVCARDSQAIVARPKRSRYNDHAIGWAEIRNGACTQAKDKHKLLEFISSPTKTTTKT